MKKRELKLWHGVVFIILAHYILNRFEMHMYGALQ
jgi:hypothetical protein